MWVLLEGVYVWLIQWMIDLVENMVPLEQYGLAG